MNKEVKELTIIIIIIIIGFTSFYGITIYHNTIKSNIKSEQTFGLQEDGRYILSYNCENGPDINGMCSTKSITYASGILNCSIILPKFPNNSIRGHIVNIGYIVEEDILFYVANKTNKPIVCGVSSSDSWYKPFYQSGDYCSSNEEGYYESWTGDNYHCCVENYCTNYGGSIFDCYCDNSLINDSTFFEVTCKSKEGNECKW